MRLNGATFKHQDAEIFWQFSFDFIKDVVFTKHRGFAIFLGLTHYGITHFTVVI